MPSSSTASSQTVRKFDLYCVPLRTLGGGGGGGDLQLTRGVTTGSTDQSSMHGACPVLGGTKWAANLWVWNGRRYGYG